MAVSIDASTPVRFTGTPAHNGVAVITSASFTPPAGAMLVVCVNSDTLNIVDTQTSVVSDTQGESWSQRAARQPNEGSSGLGGFSAIHVAIATASVARTVSVSLTGVDTSTRRVSAKVYVLTSQHATQTGAANGEGSSTTNSITPALFTSTNADGLAIVCDTDWQANGTFTSSDLTVDTAHYAGEISVMSGYKTISSVASISGNMDASGAGAAEHAWCAIEVIAAAGGSAPTLSSATPSGTLGTTTTATLGATTNQTSGTFYGVVDTAGNISGITAAQVKAGQNNGSVSAVAAANSAVSTSSPAAAVSGLTAATAYSYAVVQNNTNGDSNVLTGTFTTASAAVNPQIRNYGPKGFVSTLLTM